MQHVFHFHIEHFLDMLLIFIHESLMLLPRNPTLRFFNQRYRLVHTSTLLFPIQPVVMVLARIKNILWSYSIFSTMDSNLLDIRILFSFQLVQLASK